MKNKNELRNIAAMIADNVVSVECSFYMKSNYNGNSQKLYSFKATKAFAKTLTIGELVIGKVNKAEMPFAVVCVQKVHDECLLEKPEEFVYGWIFQKVDTMVYDDIVYEENRIVEDLYSSQKRAMRSKVIESLAISQEDREKFANVAIGSGIFEASVEEKEQNDE